jgi:hypothetical protein
MARFARNYRTTFFLRLFIITASLFILSLFITTGSFSCSSFENREVGHRIPQTSSDPEHEVLANAGNSIEKHEETDGAMKIAIITFTTRENSYMHLSSKNKQGSPSDPRPARISFLSLTSRPYCALSSSPLCAS